MTDKRAEEARVCTLHGAPMELGRSGLRCPRCEQLARRGEVIVAGCPHCGANLVSLIPDVKGVPRHMIRLGWSPTEEQSEKAKHDLLVSAVWGDYAFQAFPVIPTGVVLDLFCLACGKKMPRVSYCPTCRAQVMELVALYMFGEMHGKVQICSRRGCYEHWRWRSDQEMRAAAAGVQFMATGRRDGW